VLREINAAREPDAEKALREFDEAFFGHIGFVVSNAARALFLGVTGAAFVMAPGDADTRRYFRQLTRYSAAFAFATDLAMLLLGGQLKRKEKISARLGDILSFLYLCSAALKRYEDGGRERGELPLLDWSVQDALFRIEAAFSGLIDNFPHRLAALKLRVIAFPLGRRCKPPGDDLGHRVASLLLEPSAVRERLTDGVYVPSNADEPIAQLEHALRAALAVEPIYARIYAAAKRNEIAGHTPDELAAKAQERGIISRSELEAIVRSKALRREVIMVDDFPPDFGKESANPQPSRSVPAGAARKSA
jgi:acyl-CoA dehydrogenase